MSARQKTQQVPCQIAATAAAGSKSQRSTSLESNNMQLGATLKQGETAESPVLMHETGAGEVAPKKIQWREPPVEEKVNSKNGGFRDSRKDYKRGGRCHRQ